jgi:pimeloyl-ACP methyl ester carboxylesterase
MRAPENFVDLHPSDSSWSHHNVVDRDGIRLHFVRQGTGPSVLLLHGWPGFWYDWRRVIPALVAKGFEVVAPDLRGFGDSEKPDLPPREAYSSEAQSASVQSCVEALNLQQMTVVGYDVGSRVAQTLARSVPKRIRGLVLCNPSYPGIGDRRLEYAAQSQFWYQHFHNTSVADAVIGHNRETVRAYLSHFYHHWVGRKDALRKTEFEAIVDTYAREGAVRGSLNWVRSGAGTGLSPKLHELPTAGDLSESVQITHPTRILWGELDPIFPPSWADNLSKYFPNMTLKMLPDVGHFAPFEAPEEIVAAVENLRS